MTIQILNIVTSAAIVFIVASGVVVIFGVMNVINLAHGALIVLGLYTALEVTNRGWNPWLAFAIAPLVGFGIGAILEVLLIRRLYARSLDTILATWGVGIVITQLVMSHYGRSIQFATGPLQHTVKLLGTSYSMYRLVTVAMAAVLGLLLVLLLRYTQWGLIARAVIMNGELSRGLGVNVGAVRLVTFSLGCGLAVLAGVMLTPMYSVDPNMGTPWLITAFMVALVAGPSIQGLALSAFVLGCGQTLASYFITPVAGSLAIVLLAVAVLRILPGGLASLSLPSLLLTARRS
jgi:branched-subunit amino acid ABC-type transport system permease component